MFFRSFPSGAVIVIVCSFVWRSESILLYPNNTLFQVISSPPILISFLPPFYTRLRSSIGFLKYFRTRKSVFLEYIVREIRFRDFNISQARVESSVEEL